MKKQPRMTGNAFKVLASILSAPEREMAGAGLIQKTGLMSGTLYPMLMRLEAAGWLKARWEAGSASSLGRPRRRYYSVTAKGAAHARSYQNELLNLDPSFAQPQKG